MDAVTVFIVTAVVIVWTGVLLLAVGLSRQAAAGDRALRAERSLDVRRAVARRARRAPR